MYAIEFETKLKNRTIRIPKNINLQKAQSAKVILLIDKIESKSEKNTTKMKGAGKNDFRKLYGI
jgi:hypothetical protein